MSRHPASSFPCPRGLIGFICVLVLAACAQLPRSGYTSPAHGAMAYALDGPPDTVTVVLQSGLGDGRSSWDMVWPLVRARHRVFALDRPGYGDSPATAASREPCQVAGELRAALREAGVSPPYLLVGHSLGGLYQHVFARLYVSSQTLTNTTLRQRFKLHEKHRNQITNLIGDAVEAGRIKRKDAGSGNKFAEYLPYWA